MEELLQDAEVAAKALLGYRLIHDSPKGRTAGIIVETEAYTADDEASHTFRGQTKRNSVMFGPAGHAYIYFTYGMHHCFNIVTGSEGDGQGVLIRALEPVEGLELMHERRGVDKVLDLTNGPAKLVEAMGITPQDSGADVLSGSLRVEPDNKPKTIVSAKRVGISRAKHLKRRFYIKGNSFVSKA